ncbi:MAG: protein translocase SEC61 complex subunit gamma [Thermoprotei archaeon]|nr:MAG: protein translocase SEC61 complex subunit gamma [Thermoprotei archaeon]RLF00488.1 MAG: protein translocase SEC61 complex subunit gamma [Thermoprotei archaeon]
MKKFFSEVTRILRITKKPSKSVFLMTLRVSFLGLVLLGSVGFIIQIIGLTIVTARIPRPPPDIVIMALISVAIVILAVMMYLRRGRGT